jgi:hypothetical protein
MFTLSQVVPWGRSFDEYCRMFALTDDDLRSRIVGCGDGPASFNAEASRRGGRVVSCDPIYRCGAADIRERIAATAHEVLEQTRRHAGNFVWTGSIRSVDELGLVRKGAMDGFLEDYESGKAAGRYLDAELPALPFSDGEFDLALCSHFLFLYTTQLDEAFHRAAVREMCRVAREVRIFPLLGLDAQRSAHVEGIISNLTAAGYAVQIEQVPYEFQRGGNQMMRIRRLLAVSGAVE